MTKKIDLIALAEQLVGLTPSPARCVTCGNELKRNVRECCRAANSMRIIPKPLPVVTVAPAREALTNKCVDCGAAIDEHERRCDDCHDTEWKEQTEPSPDAERAAKHFNGCVDCARFPGVKCNAHKPSLCDGCDDGCSGCADPCDACGELMTGATHASPFDDSAVICDDCNDCAGIMEETDALDDVLGYDPEFYGTCTYCGTRAPSATRCPNGCNERRAAPEPSPVVTVAPARAAAGGTVVADEDRERYDDKQSCGDDVAAMLADYLDNRPPGVSTVDRLTALVVDNGLDVAAMRNPDTTNGIRRMAVGNAVRGLIRRRARKGDATPVRIGNKRVRPTEATVVAHYAGRC